MKRSGLREGEHSREPLNQSASWPWVQLQEVAELNPHRPNIVRAASAPITFIPMAVVQPSGAGIGRPGCRPYCEISKGYTCFAEGDILFAKITPCMQNGKIAIVKQTVDGIGFASTEFHVIRPCPRITAEWILNFLLQPDVLSEAERHFTGAVGQQRVPVDFLRELRIPLPPLPIQRSIAAQLKAQLEEVDKARTALQAQIAAANALPTASLRAVFGDPAYSGAGAAQVTLGEILTLRKEVIHPRDRPTGHATFVGLEHVESKTGARLGAVELELSALTGRKPRFYKGDIVYGYLRPYLNKVWLADFDGVCSVDQYVYTVDRTRADAEFVSWFMRSPRYLALAPVAETPGQLPRIRTQEVAQVPLGLPPLAVQHSLAAHLRAEIDSSTELRTILEARLATLNQFPAALLRQVFGQTPRAAENLHS